jgi:hypothetical protein
MKNGGKLPVWVAAPTYPSKKTTLSKIARMNGARLTNKLVKNPDAIIYFENATFGDSTELTNKYPNARIINVNCSDISKEHVHLVHQESFGYSMNLDPRTHVGLAVEKSDENAVHDGQEVMCPIESPKANTVYQTVLDNRNDNGEYVDIRVPVIGGKIPLVYLKFKTKKNRFTNKAHRATLHQPEELFSEEEISQIEKYAAAMKVDFCEFDVLFQSLLAVRGLNYLFIHVYFQNLSHYIFQNVNVEKYVIHYHYLWTLVVGKWLKLQYIIIIFLI